MQTGHKNLLGDYAAINYHEFWAVSVETFFESPQRFKQELPDLYHAMVQLLDQDPLLCTSGIMTIIPRRGTQPLAVAALALGQN